MSYDLQLKLGSNSYVVQMQYAQVQCSRVNNIKAYRKNRDISLAVLLAEEIVGCF